MTTFIEEGAICANCGSIAHQKRLGSTYIWSEPDLDTRPGEDARGWMHYWIQECRKCDYVAGNLGDAMDPRTRALLKSPEWSELKRSMRGSWLAGRFLRYSAIQENIGALERAANGALWAAWASDDAGDKATAILSRQRAANFLKRALAEDKIDAEKIANVQLVLIDVLRRAGLWEEALARCRDFKVGSLLEKPNDEFRNMKAVLLFEQHLCETHDDLRYGIGAAKDFAADQLPPVEIKDPQPYNEAAVSVAGETLDRMTPEEFLKAVANNKFPGQ
jgi:hypothetical protein